MLKKVVNYTDYEGNPRAVFTPPEKFSRPQQSYMAQGTWHQE